MTKLRILHTITGLNLGGAELMLARYLDRLDQCAFPSTVLSLMKPGPVLPQIQARGIPVCSLGLNRNLPRPSALLTLRNIIQRNKPNLVHGWMYHGNMAASIGSLISTESIPSVWSIHHSLTMRELEKPMTRRVIRLLAWLSNKPAAIIYCSRTAAEQHELVGFNFRRRKIIPNGVDCQVFTPIRDAKCKLAALLGIPVERAIVGNVARYHPMKDHFNLLRALAKLIAEGHDIQGLIIGEGHAQDGPVRRAARDLGIDHRISTLGARADIPALVAGFDLYVQSSAWGEAFPLAITEAMACGIPAISTDVGDCAFLIGRTGRIVPPRDTEALASAIADFLSVRTDVGRALGALARLRVLELFSLDQYVKNHESVYSEVLSAKELDGFH